MDTKTQRPLLRRYALVAPRLAAFLAGRDIFYREAGGGELLRGPRVSRSRELARYARLGAAELFTRPVRRDLPRRPDWLLLELADAEADVAGAGGARLRDVVAIASGLFGELELDPVWLPTGASSATVMLAIRRSYETAAVFDLARMIADTIFERAPGLVTLASDPSSDRVRVDFRANHHWGMFRAPFSLVEGGVCVPTSHPPLHPPHEPTDSELRAAGALLVARAARPNNLEHAFAQLEKLVQTS
ncbi:MAG: hypothetical protein HY075_04535 [Deltaproteobacteria bacterium]|nr:hypothetical protein [Deltaproteobacteria bacterium]